MRKSSMTLVPLLIACAFQIGFGQDKNYPGGMVCRMDLVKDLVAAAGQNRRALNDSIAKCPKQIVYLESGNYYIDGTLEWLKPNGETRHDRILAGQNKLTTKIILKEGVATGAPMAMIKTNEDVEDNATATAFSNGVWDLSLVVENNNPKAVGIEWRSNNWGNIHDVNIRDIGDGDVGIAMTQTTAGPTLIKNVEIEGFNIGIRTGQNQAGIVLEHIKLLNQEKVGIRNCLNSLTIRDLTSSSRNPVIQNYLCPDMNTYLVAGMVTILDGSFTGINALNSSAIENDFVGPLPPNAPEIVRTGGLFLRNVTSSGYKSVVRNFPETAVGQFVFGKNLSAGINGATSAPSPDPMPLPHTPIVTVPETPVLVDSDTTHWVAATGAVPTDVQPNGDWPERTGPDRDLSVTIGTMDATKSTLHFPSGNYFFTEPITIPIKVKRIIGYGATLYPKKNFHSNCIVYDSYETSPCYRDAPDKPLFKIEGTTNEVLHIEGIEVGTDGEDAGTHPSDKLVVFQHLSNRPVKLLSCKIFEYSGLARPYAGGPSAGTLYIEDVCSRGAARWEFGPNQAVWARQYEPEGFHPSYPKILNNGGKLWVLGLKTENSGTLLRNIRGGQPIRAAQAEIYGGFVLSAEDAAISVNFPVFENIDSKMTLVYTHLVEKQFGWPLQIKQIEAGVVRRVMTEDIPYSLGVSRVMFYQSSILDFGGAQMVPSLSLLLP